jgi:hypothetical protein
MLRSHRSRRRNHRKRRGSEKCVHLNHFCKSCPILDSDHPPRLPPRSKSKIKQYQSMYPNRPAPGTFHFYVLMYYYCRTSFFPPSWHSIAHHFPQYFSFQIWPPARGQRVGHRESIAGRTLGMVAYLSVQHGSSRSSPRCTG